MEGEWILRRIRALSSIFTVLLLALAGQALASGVTNSGDDLRTGWYPNQPTLTPQLVSGGTFGQLWSTAVSGQVYAQPLLSGRARRKGSASPWCACASSPTAR